MAADEVMARALAWLEYYRQRGVPYVVVSLPSARIANFAVNKFHQAGFIVEGVDEQRGELRVKIPASRLPDDPDAPHGRCAFHGAPLLAREDPWASSGGPFCSVAGERTSAWVESAGRC